MKDNVNYFIVIGLILDILIAVLFFKRFDMVPDRLENLIRTGVLSRM
jgi:regulatory protein YycI of two-component signal transduction system YycFG